jgi:hypothetical protein
MLVIKIHLNYISHPNLTHVVDYVLIVQQSTLQKVFKLHINNKL